MHTNLNRIGLAVILACAGAQAHAIGHLADVTIVDRDTGATLPLYYSKGEYWVAGAPGARYAIAIRNQLGERMMAVTSVDGLNVLTGAAAAWGQTGYVLGAHNNYQITGWRKSNSEVAAFEFSAASDSYAERTGRPQQVGVIGVAVFKERLPEPVYVPAPPPAAAQKSMGAGAAAEGMADRSRSTNALAQSASRAPLPSPQLGTAHGQREDSYVSQTRFERLQALPHEVIKIRYDSRENLVAFGVIHEPPTRTPNPFPNSDSASFVPDPPVRRF